jgi:hypothetical protein
MLALDMRTEQLVAVKKLVGGRVRGAADEPGPLSAAG